MRIALSLIAVAIAALLVWFVIAHLGTEGAKETEQFTQSTPSSVENESAPKETNAPPIKTSEFKRQDLQPADREIEPTATV